MAHENRDRFSDRADASSSGTLVHTTDLDDFELPRGEPDPRGWDARSTDGMKIGKVEDLLFDTAERRIRYIEVALDRDIKKQIGRDYALIPIGQARLNDDDDNVIIDLSSTELARAPLYDRTRLSRDYETSLRSWFRERKRDVKDAVTPGSRADRDIDFYASPDYDDRRFFARGRLEQSGPADRATTTGIADRITDAADNVKDRIDANPASRPGPDPTDRRI
jgi:hypothetical protein